MKIIQITAVYGIGSVGKISKAIHEYLLEQNHESFVLCGLSKKDSNNKTKNIINIAPKIERRFSKIMYFLTGYNFIWNHLSTKRIIKHINSIKPDVVHIHCCNDYYLNVHTLFRYLQKQKTKIVLTQHCEQYYTGSCGHSLNCEKWKTCGCDSKCHFFSNNNHRFPLFDKTKKMFSKMKNTFESFDSNQLAIVSCTPWLQERADQSIILKRFKNKFTIYNGADNNIYKYRNVQRQDKKVILFVTPRFEDPIKGSVYINDVARSFTGENVEIHLVGKIPEDFNIEKNIVKLGSLYGEDLAREYSSADTTIMLSKAECFPMVCVESVLSGTKIVAFKCGGPDKSYDKELATFVDWGNFKEMHAKINECLTSNYNKEAISKLAQKNYSEEAMCKNYVLVYNTIFNLKDCKDDK